jgi:hypothetical protein
MMTRRFLLILLICAGFTNITLFSCSNENDPSASATVEEVPGAEGIYLHLEYRLGVGGYMEVVYRPYLFFKDGSVYKNLDTSIDKLDIPRSRQQETEHWGTWKKQGSDFVITWSDGEAKTWKESTVFLARKATAGETISGSYRSLTGGGNIAFGGDVLTFSANTISFEGNKFTYESTSGGSSSTTTAYGSRNKAGTYELNGHAITLRFNNGEVEKKFFYFYPDSKRVFGIGTRYYVERR